MKFTMTTANFSLSSAFFLSRTILCILTLASLHPNHLRAQQPDSVVSSCIEGLPCADRRANVAFPKTVISLGADTKLEYESLTISDGTIFQTNGFALTIIAETLIVKGMLRIRAFDPEALITSPPAAPQGGAGIPYNPGPGTEGRCSGCGGLPGEKGQAGLGGGKGAPGRDAGQVRLTVTRMAEGGLVVQNNGSPGGRGGRGGDGGAGGTGEQGGRARTGIFDCSNGPGVGGQGGSGGSGGSGGDGGRGGDGGIVLLQLPQGTKLKVDATATGGLGGDGGDPGQGGLGGDPGYGGRGDGRCQGKEADRRGPPGQRGASGQSGRKGEPGRAGLAVTN